MAHPTRATYQRRRAVAGAAAVAVLLLLALGLRGLTSGDDASSPASSKAAVTASKPAKPVRPRPRTDVAAIASRANVPVLCYHQVRPLTSADSAQDRTYIVPPKVLDAQLGALQRAGFTSVSADAVAAHLAEGKPLPKKPVLITFDDASAGQYTRGEPLLRKHGFKATFFVMTVVLGKPGWLTKGQVRKLDRDGMEIATHTWDHQPVPKYAGNDWKTQLTEPKAELEKIVGHPIDIFAYPFGLWSPAAFRHLRQGGVKIAFQLADKLDRTDPMHTVRRVIVGPDVSGPGVLKLIREDF